MPNRSSAGPLSAGPDPSFRTVEHLTTAVTGLKELHETRLDAMDKAIVVAHDDLVRVPTDVQKAVGALKEVLQETFKIHAEKFESVQRQFEERDTRASQIADLSQKALDAALLTAEKAVGKQSEAFSAATAKSEAAATKQIDAIGTQMTSATKTTDDKFAGVNGQIARIDAALAALNGRSTGHGEIWGYVLAALAILAAIAATFIS